MLRSNVLEQDVVQAVAGIGRGDAHERVQERMHGKKGNSGDDQGGRVAGCLEPGSSGHENGVHLGVPMRIVPVVSLGRFNASFTDEHALRESG
jgi:hypothetical protein